MKLSFPRVGRPRPGLPKFARCTSPGRIRVDRTWVGPTYRKARAP